jgi:(4S)-4-hydroxy-5-phosphonooxypentane-2,3-dione isomerase
MLSARLLCALVEVRDYVMERIILKGFVVVPDDDLDVVILAFPEHIKNTQNEIGCLVFEVTQDKSDTNKLHVYEEFIDKAAFDLHRERVRDSKWGAVSKSCERHYDINV